MHKSKHKKLLTLVIAGLLVLGLLFAAALVATDPSDNLVITESELLTHPSGARVVAGIVENKTTNRSYGSVQVTSPENVRPKWLGGCATTVC